MKVINRIKNKCFPVLQYLLFLFFFNVSAQNGNSPEDSMSLDPGIIHGQLRNGFSYFIKNLPQSKNKVSMRLIVKAGGNNENINQYGMAHFLEHLPFSRTKNFKNIRKNEELLNEMEMEKTDIGGMTGGRQTIYRFNFPSGNHPAFLNGIQFFRDIASGDIRFKKEDIDGERGAFFEEYLFSGTKTKYNELKALQSFSTLYKGLKSPDKYQDYIRNFKVLPLKEFYKKWYRADAMALVIVGNVKKLDSVKNIIQTQFGDIESKEPIKSLGYKTEYLKRSNQFTIIKDTISPISKITQPVKYQFYTRYNDEESIFRNFKQKQLLNLLMTLTNNRLYKAQIGYNIPYRFHLATDTGLPAVKLEIETSKRDSRKAIQKAFSVIKQIKKNGFTFPELEGFKEDRIKILESRDTLSISFWTEEITNYYADNGVLPYRKNSFLKNFWYELSLAELNRFANKILSETPEDIAVIIPRKEKPVNEKTIRKWIKSTEAEVKRDTVNTPQFLIPPDKVAQLLPAEYQNIGQEDSGAYKIILENGIELILMPFTPSKGRYQEEIMLHGFAPIGTSDFNNKDYFEASYAPEIVRHSGVGNLNKFQLKDFFHNTSLTPGVVPYISSEEFGFNIDFKPEDLELAIQLTYLYMTAPRKDKEAFKDWKLQEKRTYLKDVGLRTKLDFYQMVHEIIGNYSVNPQGITKYEAASKLDYGKAFNIYNQLISNPSDFTFIITGEYDLHEAIPILRKYLGNISEKTESRDGAPKNEVNYQLSKPPFKKIFIPETSIENTHLFYTFLRRTKEQVSLQEEIESEIIKEVLNYKLMTLRYEKKRDVYLTGARNEINRESGYHSINIFLSCSKEDLNTIENDLNIIINKLKLEGISEDLFETIMQSHIKPKFSEAKRKQNREVLESLYNYYRYHIPISKKDSYKEILEHINITTIKGLLNKYLDQNNLMKFVTK